MQRLCQDVRYAMRVLQGQPGFTFVAMLTLALGIDVNTAIFSVVDAVLLKALPYADADRLVMLWERPPGFPSNSVSAANLLDWKSQTRVFEQMAARSLSSFNLSGQEQPEQVITLALGIGANTAIFSVVNAVLLQPHAQQSLSSSPSNIVRRYLAAKDRETALSLLAQDYRLWFEKKEGQGISKEDVARMLEWDFALTPRHKIQALHIHGREVIVKMHEDNDFSLLIGFPGWDADSTFLVNESGTISSQEYVPRKGQLDWKPYLERAIPWLKEHYPEALARIYPNNRLKQTTETAKEWVEILRAWRVATKQPNPTTRK